MIVGYIPIAFLGALGSTALMWPHGAPVGGSLAILLVAARSYLGETSRDGGRGRGVHAHFLPTWTAAARR